MIFPNSKFGQLVGSLIKNKQNLGGKLPVDKTHTHSDKKEDQDVSSQSQYDVSRTDEVPSVVPPQIEQISETLSPNAEQYGKSIAFGGQQAQQFFDRQYGRPTQPPNVDNEDSSPLAQTAAGDESPLEWVAAVGAIVSAVKAKKESDTADKNAANAVNANRDINSGINLNGDPKNLKVSDTTFIPKKFNKWRQPPGGSSNVDEFVNKGSYKVGEEIDEDDYAELGGKLDIHNITPVQTNKKGELFVTGGRRNSQKFFGKEIPDVQKNKQKK